PFLMAATIIIYAGAIIVTFLFVIMLAQQEGLSDADARSREPLLSTLTGFVLLGALLYVIRSGSDSEPVRELNATLAALRAASHDETLGHDEKDALKTRTRLAVEALGFTDLLQKAEGIETGQADLLPGLEAVIVLARERLTLAPPEKNTPMSDLS